MEAAQTAEYTLLIKEMQEMGHAGQEIVEETLQEISNIVLYMRQQSVLTSVKKMQDMHQKMRLNIGDSSVAENLAYISVLRQHFVVDNENSIAERKLGCLSPFKNAKTVLSA